MKTMLTLIAMLTFSTAAFANNGLPADLAEREALVRSIERCLGPSDQADIRAIAQRHTLADLRRIFVRCEATYIRVPDEPPLG